MTTFEELSKLKKMGMYSSMLGKGIIPLKYDWYFGYYEYWLERLSKNKSLGNSIMKSTRETSKNFKVSDMTIHRAVKEMRE